MSVDHQKLKEILAEAVARETPEERRACLDTICSDDAELRAEAEHLLNVHEQAGDFLEQPAGPTIEGPIGETPGTVIGPYKLLQQIGEGGFGVVFMAEQREPIVRRVALKIVKPGMDTREVIARFEAERQALALMDHPNIAKVFDAGATDAGRPYFVMELVKGIPITTFCDEQKLDTQQRLELLLDVCSAVNHAHQKGIIHRDLKPSNVLVTLHGDQPVPKIIDFGIAKATEQRLTEKTLFTAFGQFVGTPVYMSPEQAALSGLDIDTRSDVYALGVLLYELLSGKPPFDPRTLLSAGYEEMRRIIREEDPPRPSTRLATLAGEERTSVANTHRADPNKLSNLVRGDLDWIVMKAMEKDRTRRYETANAFALDIRHHLHHEPVAAAGPTPGYKLRKFVRRRRVPVAVGAAAGLALLAGAVVSSWQAVRAEDGARRTTETLSQLRAAAPAFLDEAENLVRLGQIDRAVEKIDLALTLQPDRPDFLSRKADLLRCQLRIPEAIQAYERVLALDPDHSRANARLESCRRVLSLERNAQGGLSAEALSSLHDAMRKDERPAAELLPVAESRRKEFESLRQEWLERLRELPVGEEKTLEQRLTMHPEGFFTLDLSSTMVTASDLELLRGMPVGHLTLYRCRNLVDLRPLEGLPLRKLDLNFSSIANLEPLRELQNLDILWIRGTRVRNLEALAALPLTQLDIGYCPEVTNLKSLRGLPLEELDISNTGVTSLAPLEGMTWLKKLWANEIPARDFEYLAGLPIETLSLQGIDIPELGFLEAMPVRVLSITGCSRTRNYGVLATLESLEVLALSSSCIRALPEREQAAIDALLANHPSLRQVADWYMEGGQALSTLEPLESFRRRWNSMRGLIRALRAEGLNFTLGRESRDEFVLTIRGSQFNDLSVLRDVPLAHTYLAGLVIGGTAVSDLSPLRGLPLRGLLFHDTKVTDVSPLAKMESLQMLRVSESVDDFEPLRQLPNLKRISFGWDEKMDRPDMTADQFWEHKPTEHLQALRALRDRDWEAAQDFFRWLAHHRLEERDGREPFDLLRAGTVLAMADDREAYDRLCDKALDKFAEENTKKLSQIWRLAGLKPFKDKDRIGRTMRWHDTPNEEGWRHFVNWAEYTKALTEYRSNRPEAARQRLAALDRQTGTLGFLVLLLEAMTENKLGHAPKAEELLAKAKRDLPEVRRACPYAIGQHWHNILACELFLEEAENLIAPRTTTPVKPDRN